MISALCENLFTEGHCIATSLQEGLDPLTGQVFQEDTILNSLFIKEYNKKVSEILAEQLQKQGSSKKRHFSIDTKYLNADTINEFHGLNDNISISSLCHLINKDKNIELPSIRASQIANWLCNKGFLTELQNIDNARIRIPTELGKQLGIRCIHRQSSEGKMYRVNVYSQQAQIFIVNHINEVFLDIYSDAKKSL